MASWLRSAQRAYTAALRLDALEALKTRVRALDDGLSASKRVVARARADAELAQREARDTAAEVTALLHRKARWDAGDAERFSALCREEIALAEAEACAGRALAEAEDAAETSLRAFLGVLRERYQEEMAVGEASRRLGYILTAANTVLFACAFYDRREQRGRGRRVEGLMEELREKLEVAGEEDPADGGGGGADVVGGGGFHRHRRRDDGVVGVVGRGREGVGMEKGTEQAQVATRVELDGAKSHAAAAAATAAPAAAAPDNGDKSSLKLVDSEDDNEASAALGKHTQKLRRKRAEVDENMVDRRVGGVPASLDTFVKYGGWVTAAVVTVIAMMARAN